MPRGPIRDAARTRELLLTTAASLVEQRGAGVSLDQVASAAGVSKGGLLHHFPSRDALLTGVAEHLVSTFNAAVDRALESEEQAPGRVVRAYVRTVFRDAGDAQRAHQTAVLFGTLGGLPEVRELMAADKRFWEGRFATDGLDPDLVTLVVRAADGTSLAALFEGEVNTDEVERMRTLLLDLTRRTDPLLPGR